MDLEEIKPDISGWKRIQDHYQRDRCEKLPKITVVIPSFNQAHLLSLTLDSFVEQKNVDKELVIVDGGSTDHTLSLLDKYKQHVARVYYVTSGASPLMVNKGFNIASGTYVCVMQPGLCYLNQSSLCHMAHVAFDNNLPDMMFSGTYLSEESFVKVRDAVSRDLDELEPFYTYFPFNKTWLKRGFSPSSPYSIWFKKDYVQKLGGIRYNTFSLKLAIFDLLCRINRDKEANIASTFWATTAYDKRGNAGLTVRDFLRFYTIIFKYFGLLSAVLWVFRDKPFRLVNSAIHRIRSFFQES